MTNPTDKLQELRRLNEARTPGEWQWTGCNSTIKATSKLYYYDVANVSCRHNAWPDDAAFIAAMANNADWLLSCVEALQEVLKDVDAMFASTQKAKALFE